jgi:hypothetical protein
MRALSSAGSYRYHRSVKQVACGCGPGWRSSRRLPPTQALAPSLPPVPAEPNADLGTGPGQTEPETAASRQDPAAEPAAAQSGQRKRTRQEAREAVRALLSEDLTDREIARRVGVSPATVAAVKAEIEKTGT